MPPRNKAFNAVLVDQQPKGFLEIVRKLLVVWAVGLVRSVWRFGCGFRAVILRNLGGASLLAFLI
jgi:hypothetical protein